MTLIDHDYVDLPTPSGPMRTHIIRPTAPGRYPGIVFFSEIFQITPPVRRMAALVAAYGFILAMPEVYHEFEQPGTVLPYDQTGSDRGNALKYTKEVAAHDADVRAILDHLALRPDCTGKLGSLGICLGGHLAFRAAFRPQVLAAVCFYATDLHKASLGRGDDSLARAGEIEGDLLMIWGRQDPHVPTEARVAILDRLNEAGTRLTWLEVNGAHAFMRDEGPRYDPELAGLLYPFVIDLFRRVLANG